MSNFRGEEIKMGAGRVALWLDTGSEFDPQKSKRRSQNGSCGVYVISLTLIRCLNKF